MKEIAKDWSQLPSNLPIPQDDGLANHLVGLTLPQLKLQSANLKSLSNYDLHSAEQAGFKKVFFCYPMTGQPNKELPPNWNNIAGARGCTPQNLSMKENYQILLKLKAIPLGITTQNITEIKELVQRLAIPYNILSDENLELQKALNLPTFKIKEQVYLKRLTFIVEKQIIKKIFYPVFPPDKHIFQLLKWLETN